MDVQALIRSAKSILIEDRAGNTYHFPVTPGLVAELWPGELTAPSPDPSDQPIADEKPKRARKRRAGRYSHLTDEQRALQKQGICIECQRRPIAGKSRFALYCKPCRFDVLSSGAKRNLAGWHEELRDSGTFGGPILYSQARKMERGD